MENTKRYDWVEFYMEFANKLLTFKDNRQELIKILLAIFEELNLKYPLIDSKDEIGKDVCPFSVMGTFNKQISNENRINILRKIKEKFDIKADVPTDFSGIPILNNLSSMFYSFEQNRQEDDIQNLWQLFEKAIHYADDKNIENYNQFCMYYDKVIEQSQVKWNISMGLFWIRPYTYLNLDTKNRNFLLSNDNEFKNIKNISDLKKVPKAKEYIELIEECNRIFSDENSQYKNFIELSINAFEMGKTSSNASFLRWFKPVLEALKELGGTGTPSEVRNKIIEDENLSDDYIEQTRGKNNVNKFANEVAFARNYLVYEDLIDGTEYGLWKITDKGRNIVMTDDEASKIFLKWVSYLKDKRDSSSRNMNYWLVGSMWSSEGEQLQRFINEGIWENGYDNKYTNVVNQMMPGDKIAIKSSYTKSKDIPFENNGNPVSVMKIKVTGTVIENYNNGRKIKVKWDEENEKEWYMYTGRSTIWNITPRKDKDDWMKEELIKFVFENEEQDYQKFINDPYWNDRYGIDMNEEENKGKPYTKEDFLKEVFMTEKQYDILRNTLIRKKNIILQGVPGVGKTFCAKKLMHSIIGKDDDTNIRTVQFHQSYSYEDFIQGFRPNADGKFELKNGVFYELVTEARKEYDAAGKEKRKAKEFCIIIDEINRGNLSKVFGELMMLIEADKRSEKWAINLTYSNEEFYIPKNLYIIGTMNTADRSLAMIDYALRRRFSFITLYPAFGNEQLTEYLTNKNGIEDNFVETISNKFVELNNYIKGTLNENFVIGHSYFIDQLDPERVEESYEEIIEYEIKPLLEEYFFGDKEKINEAINKLKL